MSDNNYAAILERSWDDIPPPKLLPVGSWLLKGKNVAMFPPKEDGAAIRIAFFYEAREPMDDVSEAELQALGEDYSYAENDVVKQFFINRNKDWDSVRKHLELHGIETKGQSQKETFDAFKGSEVVAYLSTKTFVNGAGQQITDNDPSNFAAVT